MLAGLEAKRACLLCRQHWLANIIAGLIVGVVALPLAMAFAIASGVKPEQGLYTAIVAGVAVSLLGGSRVQIAGPTGAFIVILAGIVAQHGVDGLQIATLMAGIILLLFGLARMRSEEHTSELQSLMRISYAVFCLKKKKHNTKQNTYNIQSN